MSRKPVDELAKSVKPQGRAGVWKAVRAFKGEFTTADIVSATDIPPATCRDYLKALSAAGIVDIIRTDTINGAIEVHHYRLAKDIGAEPPRLRADGSKVTQGQGVEALWRTVKVLGSFTPAELALTASTADVMIATSTAADYLKHLCHAGYVRRRDVRYSFVRSRDPGPLAPQIQRIKQVFDPNSNTVVWPIRTGGEK